MLPNYVHKDIHSGNIFISLLGASNDPNIDLEHTPSWAFKIGDLGITNIKSKINPYSTILAEWMLPPESLNPQEFGTVGKQTDIYHTGLLFLSLLLRNNLQFTKQDILNGVPRQRAENLLSPYGKVIAKALRRHVEDRTQTALEFWREIRKIAQTMRDSSYFDELT